MKRKTRAGLIAIVAVVVVAMFGGCVEEEALAPASTPTTPSGDGGGSDDGGTTPTPTLTQMLRAPNAALVLEDARAGSSEITLIHHGGETVVDAFKGDAPYWNSLGVWINGAIYEGAVKLNGGAVSAGDFTPGEELELFLDQELTNAYITVIYIPTGDILQRVKVGTPSSTPISMPTPSGNGDDGNGKTTPTPTQTLRAPNMALVIEDARAGSSKITLIHKSGDTIVDAFKGNPPYWNSLEIRIHGAIYEGDVKLNGGAVSAGDFKLGDKLDFFLDQELTSGDTVTVIYTPTGDLLQRVKIR